MCAFKFRLEKVLRVRQIKEEQRQREWALLEKKARQEEGKLKDLLEQRYQVTAFGYQQTDREIRTAMYAYLRVLDQKIEKQRHCLHKSEELAWQAKQIWFAARKEEEKMAILKDKQYQEYLREELHREQKLLDEMGPRLQKVLGGGGSG